MSAERSGAAPGAEGVASPRVGWLVGFYRTTIGRKMVMAVTGVLLTGFVVLHMAGNLLVFQGPEALNDYAALLRRSAVLLWTVRVLLLGAVVLHVHSAWSLTRQARAARPQGYDREVLQASTYAARSMRVGGVLLLVFIVVHLLHFTTGTAHPDFRSGDVYRNVMVGFRSPAMTAFYLAAMAALALHLLHGVGSLFQTLGADHPRLNPARRRLATVVAVGVGVGFAAVPLAVYFRLVR